MPCYKAFHRRFARGRLNQVAPFGGAKRGTILDMPIFEFFIVLLEVMFFVGLSGSSIVVIISFIEDGKELFGKD